ncbi:hypothetical protein ACVWW6_000388 [Bradyrhizobium sp. USDA 3311]
MSILTFLRRLHLVDPFSEADVEEAKAENALREHSAVMDRIEAIVKGTREAQSRLRESIAYSRSSSHSAPAQSPDVMARLVHDMKSMGQNQRKGAH